MWAIDTAFLAVVAAGAGARTDDWAPARPDALARGLQGARGVAVDRAVGGFRAAVGFRAESSEAAWRSRSTGGFTDVGCPSGDVSCGAASFVRPNLPVSLSRKLPMPAVRCRPPSQITHPGKIGGQSRLDRLSG